MSNNPAPKPVAEDPNVVVGGPLDPTSAEGTPPEGHVTGAPPAATEPIHRGFSGDISDTEALKKYAKQLEDMVTARMGGQPPAPTQPQPTPFQAAAPAQSAAKDKFSELIFAKPDEAFEVAVGEAERRIEAKRDGERQRENFWKTFYQSNQDLSRMEPVVQSVLTNHRAHVATLRTEKEVSDFLSSEARKVVDYVKKETGYTETRLPSQSVASLGGSREAVPPPPNQAPKMPLSLVEQLAQAKAKRAKK